MRGMNRRTLLKRGLTLLGAAGLAEFEPQAAGQRPPGGDNCNCTAATDGSPLDIGPSEIRPLIDRYQVDLRNVNRVYSTPGSALRQTKREEFYRDHLKLLEGVKFDTLSQPGKVDYILLRRRLERESAQVMADGRQDAEIAKLVPFQQTVIGFEEARRRMETIDGQKSAAQLARLSVEIASARDSKPTAPPPVLASAAQRLAGLRNTMKSWHDFYALYDPKFSWWVEVEYKKSDEAMEAFAQELHKVSGATGPLTAPAPPAEGFGGGRGGGGGGGRGGGRGGAVRSTGPRGSNEELSGAGPAGNAALLSALSTAMIAYTPDELVGIANQEFAWCDREMLRASKELGFGAEWKKALEAVKNKYVEPGQMIYLVRDLSREAIEYLEKRELVTIPPMLKEDYWEEAMTPQAQLSIRSSRAARRSRCRRRRARSRTRSGWRRCAGTTCSSRGPRCFMS